MCLWNAAKAFPEDFSILKICLIVDPISLQESVVSKIISYFLEEQTTGTFMTSTQTGLMLTTVISNDNFPSTTTISTKVPSPVTSALTRNISTNVQIAPTLASVQFPANPKSKPTSGQITTYGASLNAKSTTTATNLKNRLHPNSVIVHKPNPHNRFSSEDTSLNQTSSKSLFNYKYLVFNSTKVHLDPAFATSTNIDTVNNETELSAHNHSSNTLQSKDSHSSINTNILIGSTLSAAAAVIIIAVASWYLAQRRSVLPTAFNLLNKSQL